MTVQHSGTGLELLRSEVRRALYDHLSGLSAEPDVSPVERGRSAQELTEVVGLHLTTVRFHLDQLVAAGLLTTLSAPPAGAGRPRKLYAVPAVRLTPPTTSEAQEAYETLSAIVRRAEEAEPQAETAAALERSGRLWARDHVEQLAPQVGQASPATTPGAWVGKIGAVLDLLVGWGHDPELRTSPGAQQVDILLRDCPFLALARDNPHQVCGVHRGLLRGALDALGEESADLNLEPLVDHHTCRAHLSVKTPFADRGEQR